MSKNTIKKFLTIDEQIEHLKKDYKLVVNDERLFKRFLRKFNYSRLIYDYGIAIRNNFGMFLPNTNSTDIINVYNFDTVIKERLLSKIFNIEKRLGTAIAYYVAKEMKNK
jgi:abortive infection bacteriophage resistance protein